MTMSGKGAKTATRMIYPPVGRKYGPGGEGEHHKCLRLWITANPQKVRRSFVGARSETEFDLDS